MVSAGCRLAGGQMRDRLQHLATNRLAETDQSRPIGPPEDRSATNRLAGGQKRDQSARRNRPITTTRLAETDQSRPLGSPKARARDTLR